MTSGYEADIINDSPILFLPLDDTSGSTAAALVGSDGTYVGSPTLGADGPDPIGSTAVNPTTGDAIDTPSLTLGTTQAQTWEMWANNISQISSSAFDGLMCGTTHVPGAGSNYAHIMFGNGSSAIANEVCMIWTFHQNDESITYWTASTIAAGWHHHVFTYTGSDGSWEWYIDGTNATSQGFTKNNNLGGASGFQSDVYGLNRYYDGTRADWDGYAALVVYDYALSAAKVAEHYAGGLWAQGAGSPMVMG